MKEKIAALKNKLVNGVTPALATPLHEHGYRVNTAVLPQLVDFLIDKGVKGLFVGGTTGEGILLDAAERKQLHENAVTSVNGRVPVLLHIGANQTAAAVALTLHAVELKADAILAVTPTFYGMDEGSLTAYYQAIATAAPATPLLLYDIPHMAVNGISPSLFAQLSAKIPTMAGVKTSRPDAQIVRQLIDAAPDYAIVLAGNERIALGLLALGADGLISGLSTAVPEPFVKLARAVGEGDLDAARRMQQLINQLLDCMPAQQRIGAIKSILADRGIAMGPAVPPRPMPLSSTWPQMKPILAEAGI